MAEQTSVDNVKQANAFMLYNHITVHRSDSEHAEAFLDMVPEHLNPYGFLHGGAYYTMADCAGGHALRSDGRAYVTLNGGLSFVRGVAQGRVTAYAEVIHRGHTTGLVRIEIRDEEHRRLAFGDFSYFCTSAR